MELKNNKEFWLYIHPHTYCNMIEDKALLYNTITFRSVIVEQPQNIELLQTIHKRTNLGVASIDVDTMAIEPYASFIAEFCKENFGTIISKDAHPDKPIQLMPILNLQNDMARYNPDDPDNTVGIGLQHLMELTIYLNDKCLLDCPNCAHYSNQCTCCKKSDKPYGDMSLSILQSINSQIQSGVIGKINLLGGDLFKYTNFTDLSKLFSTYNGALHYWTHYLTPIDDYSITENVYVNIIVTFPLQSFDWSNLMKHVGRLKCIFHFYVTNLEEYEKAESLMDSYGLTNFSIHPIYNGNNLFFFKEFVFTSCDDLSDIRMSMRDIYIRQKMNINHFGKLSIMPNGDVYANRLNPKLGNIADDTLLLLIKKEMISNTAWRQIRDNAPCNKCLYQYLCPSPTNYEQIIGKNNLCHIVQ